MLKNTALQEESFFGLKIRHKKSRLNIDDFINTVQYF